MPCLIWMMSLEWSSAQQLEATHTKVIGYGFKELKTFDIETLKIRMLKGSNLKSSIDGLEFDVEFGSERTKFKTRVVGRFNASNLLSVMATLIASDVKLVDAVQVMQQVQPVMGRMERLGVKNSLLWWWITRTAQTRLRKY